VENWVSSAARAMLSLTPGFARARMLTDRDAGSASQFRPSEDGVTSVAFDSATITAGACDGSVLSAPVKPFGFTPTIVTGTSFNLIDCPSATGDRAKPRSQNSSLITTAGSLPAVSSIG
jgi:hypothetical protein